MLKKGEKYGVGPTYSELFRQFDIVVEKFNRALKDIDFENPLHENLRSTIVKILALEDIIIELIGEKELSEYLVSDNMKHAIINYLISS